MVCLRDGQGTRFGNSVAWRGISRSEVENKERWANLQRELAAFDLHLPWDWLFEDLSQELSAKARLDADQRQQTKSQQHFLVPVSQRFAKFGE